MNLHRLDLNLLVALDALLSECSITRAAARLHLSPSATSGALARLREYFEDDLLIRIGRRMAITPLGESLKPAVRDCLLHVQATVDIRPQFDPATSKRNFSLMMSDYVVTVIMPQVLQRLSLDAPGITIELIANDEQPWESLSKGEIDFLVLPKNFVRSNHPAEILFEDEFVCVGWSGNSRLEDTMTLDQCLSFGHVVARLGSHRPPTIDVWFFQRFGNARRVDVIATTFASVPHLLVGTERLSIMHRRLATLFAKTMPLKIVPVPVEMPRLVEMIQWHKYRDHDPARIWMTKVLAEAAAAAK